MSYLPKLIVQWWGAAGPREAGGGRRRAHTHAEAAAAAAQAQRMTPTVPGCRLQGCGMLALLHVSIVFASSHRACMLSCICLQGRLCLCENLLLYQSAPNMAAGTFKQDLHEHMPASGRGRLSTYNDPTGSRKSTRGRCSVNATSAVGTPAEAINRVFRQRENKTKELTTELCWGFQSVLGVQPHAGARTVDDARHKPGAAAC